MPVTRQCLISYYNKTPTFSGRWPFYSSFQNPSENELSFLKNRVFLLLAVYWYALNFEDYHQWSARRKIREKWKKWDRVAENKDRQKKRERKQQEIQDFLKINSLGCSIFATCVLKVSSDSVCNCESLTGELIPLDNGSRKERETCVNLCQILIDDIDESISVHNALLLRLLGGFVI